MPVTSVFKRNNNQIPDDFMQRLLQNGQVSWAIAHFSKKGMNMNSVVRNTLQNASLVRWMITIGLVAVVATLVGCGSTKVYTADKTVVYKDNVYNVSQVKVFSPKNEAILADKSTVNLKGMEKKAFEKLLEDNENSVFVRQTFMLDSDELVYQATSVTKWNDLSKMNKRFSSAQSDLTKFLGDKKKTQLKLK